jgi:tRNA (guanine26-N2/guanine27-N2)-dimethyltransferase
MVEWVRQYSPIHEGSLKEGMAGWQMLTKMGFMSKATETENDPMKPQKGGNREGNESSYDAGKDEIKHLVQNEIVFDEELGKDRQSRRLVRYQANPRANWGPMNRAK